MVETLGQQRLAPAMAQGCSQRKRHLSWGHTEDCSVIFLSKQMREAKGAMCAKAGRSKRERLMGLWNWMFFNIDKRIVWEASERYREREEDVRTRIWKTLAPTQKDLIFLSWELWEAAEITVWAGGEQASLSEKVILNHAYAGSRRMRRSLPGNRGMRSTAEGRTREEIQGLEDGGQGSCQLSMAGLWVNMWKGTR